MGRRRWAAGGLAVLLIALPACGRGRPPARSATSVPAVTTPTGGVVTGPSSATGTSSPKGPTSVTGPTSMTGPTPLGDRLRAVSAVASDDAWAVGDRYSAGSVLPGSLVEHWDGQAWSRVRVPDIGPVRGASANGPREVWAVGNVEFLHYDGSWDVLENPDHDRGLLEDVASVAPDDAWAVGRRLGANYPGECGSSRAEDLPLAEHWNGSAWEDAHAPQPDVHVSGLFAVDAAGPNDVWAVGSSETDAPPSEPGNGCANGPTSHARTFAMHWDGSAWSIVATPSPGEDSFLQAVSVAAPDDAWAVGHTTPSHGVGGRLFLHWDGESWTQVPDAPAGLEDPGDAAGVVALATDDAWSCGAGVQHWDGSRWSLVTGPVASLPQLNGMDASSPGDVWAVGTNQSNDDGVSMHAVIAHWNGDVWTMIPAAPFTPGDG